MRRRGNALHTWARPRAGSAQKQTHRCLASENSWNFWPFVAFDLLFERKNTSICSASSCGWGTPLGACQHSVPWHWILVQEQQRLRPKGFVPVAGGGRVQVGESTGSGHTRSPASKTGSSDVPAYKSTALPMCCLCRTEVLWQPGSCAMAFFWS